jgi:hydrogenase-4 component A
MDPMLRWEQGVRTVAVKCDLCSFSEQGPECVRICPTKAMYVVSDDALEASVETKRKVAALSQGREAHLYLNKEQE